MTSPWRAIAEHRAERRLLRASIDRLLTELESNRWPYSSTYRPRNSTAHRLAEPVLARRGLTRPEHTTED
jgi:hypothetical protein